MLLATADWPSPIDAPEKIRTVAVTDLMFNPERNKGQGANRLTTKNQDTSLFLMF